MARSLGVILPHVRRFATRRTSHAAAVGQQTCVTHCGNDGDYHSVRMVPGLHPRMVGRLMPVNTTIASAPEERAISSSSGRRETVTQGAVLALIEDDDVIETFAPNGPDQPFRIRVLPG